MKRIHMIISGDVQGVGFRAWFQRIARQRRVTGWIKNKADETVEVVAEGDEEALQELVTLARRGPEVAFVASVTTKWKKATHEFTSFTIEQTRTL